MELYGIESLISHSLSCTLNNHCGDLTKLIICKYDLLLSKDRLENLLLFYHNSHESLLHVEAENTSEILRSISKLYLRITKY